MYRRLRAAVPAAALSLLVITLDVLGVASLLAASGCRRSSSGHGTTAGDPAAKPRVALRQVTENYVEAYQVVLTGVPYEDLRPLQNWDPSRAEWSQVLRVRVVTKDAKPDERPAVAGRYAIEDGEIRFRPLLPLEPGRRFEVAFNPASIGALEAGADAASGSARASTPTSLQPITTIIATPAAAIVQAPTVVERVTPSGDQVPENLLRIYIHFSAPMGLRGGLDYVHLLDERGREVVDPFLPVDAEFWNDDRTRFTLFLDPGRVKRGVRPNEQMGRSLEAGRAYTLAIDAAWPDTFGRPLAKPHRQTFRAGAAIERPLALADWQIVPPAGGTHDPVIVTFPHALDHGLLLRALGVETREGRPIGGYATVDNHERRWRYTPFDPWPSGEHRLVVLTILEDPSGNRIGRAFETPESPRPGSPLAATASRADEPARVTRAFRIGARPSSAKGTS